MMDYETQKRLTAACQHAVELEIALEAQLKADGGRVSNWAWYAGNHEHVEASEIVDLIGIVQGQREMTDALDLARRLHVLLQAFIAREEDAR